MILLYYESKIYYFMSVGLFGYFCVISRYCKMKYFGPLIFSWTARIF